jgi:hypothetical protein
MSIAAILYSLPSMVTSALLPEVSLRPAERPQLLRRATMLIGAVVTPALVIAFFAAPIALAAFGHGYTGGTLPVLRWLIAAGFITMLNAVTGAILFIAKKSTMLTIVNIVDAIIVLGLVTFWATNATDIAISWAVGDVGNTVLFGIFAFLAIREVGWRWDKLGGEQPASTDVAPEQASADSGQLALDLLFNLAEQQRAGDMYRVYSPVLASTQTNLFSVAAMRAAERERDRQVSGAAARSAKAPDEPADTPEQGLNLLFSMAEQQRRASTRGEDPYGPRRRPPPRHP